MPPRRPCASGPGADDAPFMRTALALAARALGRSAPNPAVGCLIVRDGRVVGRGWTGDGGRPHAETIALAQAGTAARGATAYVSLEPCAHHGRTPPCSDALIAAGIARVVIPLIDPDPRVAGRGAAALEAAGIRVDCGCLETEAASLNMGFFTRIAEGRPMVTLKLAQSLDGRIATASGESRWITGPSARREVHLARARADAVLVGAGTVRADDPMLDVRDLGLPGVRPLRVVAGGRLRLPARGRLAESARHAPLLICHGPQADAGHRAAWAAAGAELVEIPGGSDGRMDPRAMLAALGARGLTRVFCEGGGRLAAGLVAAGLVDEIVIYAAGIVLGADGHPAMGPLRLQRLAEAPRYRLADVRRVGDDLRAHWLRAPVPRDGPPPARFPA
jgi:diaminohydroxyphosphoribosylaminopyrimidine deaminase / 5-amino-6-(5-phosphoribosylamino)uracil reductase